MIEIENLTCRHLTIDALTIQPGVTSVIGPNGSGKTTLLKLLAGIILPENGMIRIEDKSPRESEIGWVNEFPDRNILFGTVFDEIASSLRFRHLPCGEITIRVGKCMDALGISILKERTMRDLSGGEKIMVAVAAALVHRPRLVILDEYDSHLDFARISLIDKAISVAEIPFVVRCTQQMETAARSDHIIYLENGQIISEGVPGDVFRALADTPFYPLSWRCLA